MIFKDRTEAGKKLAEKLIDLKEKETVLYALPRGGVIVGAAIAQKLKIPLDIIVACKIGHPLQPEFGIAAVSESGHLISNEEMVATVDQEWFRDEVARQQERARKEREKFTRSQKMIPAQNRTAILVDDGVATGLTLMAAIEELKDQKPAKIIVAVPVIPPDTARKIEEIIDQLVALEIPTHFAGAVGAYYESFPQVSDEEVIKLLKNGATNSFAN